MPLTVSATGVIHADWLTYKYTTLFTTQPIRLGIIPSGSEVALNASKATIIGAEINANIASRPSISLGAGDVAFDVNGNLKISDLIQFNIIPSAQITYRQLFVLLGGSDVLRNTSGTIICVLDYEVGNDVTAPAGVTTGVAIPWLFLKNAVSGV
jgi:hypothetical protein